MPGQKSIYETFLGANKGRDRLLNFSDALLPELFKIVLLIIIANSALRFTMLPACIWSKLSCFLLVMAAGPCFALTARIFKLYAGMFHHSLSYSALD